MKGGLPVIGFPVRLMKIWLGWEISCLNWWAHLQSKELYF